MAEYDPSDRYDRLSKNEKPLGIDEADRLYSLLGEMRGNQNKEELPAPDLDPSVMGVAHEINLPLADQARIVTSEIAEAIKAGNGNALDLVNVINSIDDYDTLLRYMMDNTSEGEATFSETELRLAREVMQSLGTVIKAFPHMNETGKLSDFMNQAAEERFRKEVTYVLMANTPEASKICLEAVQAFLHSNSEFSHKYDGMFLQLLDERDAAQTLINNYENEKVDRKDILTRLHNLPLESSTIVTKQLLEKLNQEGKYSSKDLEALIDAWGDSYDTSVRSLSNEDELSVEQISAVEAITDGLQAIYPHLLEVEGVGETREAFRVMIKNFNVIAHRTDNYDQDKLHSLREIVEPRLRELKPYMTRAESKILEEAKEKEASDKAPGSYDRLVGWYNQICAKYGIEEHDSS